MCHSIGRGAGGGARTARNSDLGRVRVGVRVGFGFGVRVRVGFGVRGRVGVRVGARVSNSDPVSPAREWLARTASATKVSWFRLGVGLG